MLLTEWNWDDALAVAKEEGKIEGIEIGDAIGEVKGIKKMLALWESGVSLAEAKLKFNCLNQTPPRFAFAGEQPKAGHS